MKNRAASSSRYKTGLNAEALCRLFLRLKGYSILASRYRTKMGEIDLIAARGNSLAIIEVKARADMYDAAGAISPRQQERLVNAAALFVAQNPKYNGYHIRFDAMLVAPRRWPRHAIGAW